MVETISQNTPIQQGTKPGGVTAFSAIKELGDRADTRTRGKMEVLEDFLIEFNQAILSRIAQFYTEERQWRITGSEGESQSGTFSNKEMFKTWPRNEAEYDDKGNVTKPAEMEEYIPEMDVKVKLVDERPTTRDYYMNLAFKMKPAGLIDLKSFWYVMEEGKFPPREEVLKRLEEETQAKLAAQQPRIPQVPTQIPQQGQAPPQGATGPPQSQPQPQANPQQQVQQILEQVMQQMTPEEKRQFAQLPDEKKIEIIQQIMEGGG
jgi:hypothetical protein